MTRRPVDLATVRDVRRRLAEIAREHPEAFDPERLPTTPETVMDAIKRGRPPSPSRPGCRARRCGPWTNCSPLAAKRIRP
jgi:hypothetical protein